MTPQSDMRAAPRSVKRFGQSLCPKCQDMVLAPAVSEYVNENLIRHAWSCESCGHEFQTSVRLFGRTRDRRKSTDS